MQVQSNIIFVLREPLSPTPTLCVVLWNDTERCCFANVLYINYASLR